MAGLSLDEIHRELKVPPSTIYQWLRKKNLIDIWGELRKQRLGEQSQEVGR